MRTLHLMTQRDQPYGSQCRCCERCGLMLVGRPDSFWDEHAYVDDEKHYTDYPEEGTQTCMSKRKETSQ